MIFVDSSFWIALYTKRDSRHAQAAAVLGAHPAVRLVTTNHVRGESWTFLRTKYGHKASTGLLDGLERTTRLTLAFVGSELEHEAWTWLRRHDERAYSFVDATSFALMRSLRIRDAFAFDGDFTAAGFTELRA